MDKSGQQDIIQQLIDNTTDIISASTNGEPERLVVLAHRQKMLKQALKENMLRFNHDSRASIDALQGIVAEAVDAVRSEMGKNRGSMQATGIKKKVLGAYGTVTVSNISSE